MAERRFDLSDDALTDNALDACAGLRVPRLYAAFLRWVWEHRSLTSGNASDLFYRLTSLVGPTDPFENYTTTPRELFTFGWTGGDGEHLAFVAFDTPFDGDDYPYVIFTPGEGRVWFLAADTWTFLRQLLSFTLVEDAESEGLVDPHRAAKSREFARACSDDLGLDATPEVVRDRYIYGQLRYPNNPEFRPGIPEGWRYEPRGESVGVLAPKTAFDPGFRYQKRMWPICRQRIAKNIEAAASTLSAGYPATALLMLSTYTPFMDHTDRTSFPYYKKEHKRWNEVQRAAYTALDRPLIAKRLADDPMW